MVYEDLHTFFENLEEKYKANYDWFSLTFFQLSPYSSLCLKEYTLDECERILRLYQSGILKGRYNPWEEERVLRKKSNK